MEEESNSNRTNVAESSDDEVALLLVIKGTDHTKDSWILDSGCDHHMCYSRDAFDTYTSCEGKIIFMANNAESKCIRMGTMKIKVFDGIV